MMPAKKSFNLNFGKVSKGKRDHKQPASDGEKLNTKCDGKKKSSNLRKSKPFGYLFLILICLVFKKNIILNSINSNHHLFEIPLSVHV